MALVEFKNVEKYYGDYHALRNINLRFEKGQVVVLLGPSGSGKSTLIRTINGLEAVDKGSLLVNGHQVAGASQKDLVPLRKEVGMVFQHFNLYTHKTVLENVTLAPIKVLGIDKKEAEKTAQKYLEFVNMWDKKDSYPAMLSGGQKQRIAIARGLAMHPELLLLVQFVIVFYGLPLISDHIIMIPIYWTAVLCVGLYHGAYIAEVIRSGIQSIPSGQMEAALSQGFTYISAMRLIILPQAFRIILPPLTNQIVNLIKNTSTVAIISGVDLMFVTKSWSALNGNYIPAFLGAALLYFALCFPVAQFGRKMEQVNKKAYSL